MIHTTTNGASTKAGPDLMVSVLIVACGIRFYPINRIIFYMQSKQAATSTVYCAGTPDGLIFDDSGFVRGLTCETEW
ncbi:hypothetical protein SEENIN0B_01502 [Salmonella enterica subsp. enterica serovar Infantis str. SARB27]|uniref:Uncharacterized protein n=1 Tax=Salmonella enterica subsp. enterica serovar Infantis str. SARB27 TaxID=596155 RepID=A0A6C8G8E4_SALIN|nr:hypothetical protein SEENIN0B_01502 [Salmonella enterica subsp. enterica serovar Infantis str. SARB27]